jgi:hypothetical protein
MKLVKRWVKRISGLLIGLLIIYLIVWPIFNELDKTLPLFVALLLTYYLSAYIILPRLFWVVSLIIRKGRIPRFTSAFDGFYVDPVNIILTGTKEQLEKAFKKIDWQKADKLNIRSAQKMLRKFLVNKPYPEAPFSSLYLFGRRQDIGFQQSIGNSPRKRHHIRFWAINTDKEIDPMDLKFWTKKQKIRNDKGLMWVGSASEDIGFAFARLTYQLSHKVSPKVDKERKYILDLLKKSKAIEKITYYKPGKFKIGKYISDGRIAVARLKTLK